MSSALDIRKIKQQHAPQQPVQVNASAEKPKGIWDFLNRDIRIGKGGLPDRIKENFYMELWSLLTAGVDIRTALDLTCEEQKKKKVKKIFQEVQHLVVSGSTFSSALKKVKEFSSYEYYSIQIGEETGKLLQVLKELSAYFGTRIRQRRQILGAITYPIVVMVVAFCAVAFMVTYVVPMFSDTFRRFGSDLPAITKAVIAFSAFIRGTIGIFFLVITGIVIFCIWQSKRNWFRKLSSVVLLRTPVVGRIIQKIYLARLSNTMNLLIGAKIPILQAIRLTRQMITFYPIEQSLYSVEEDVIKGIPLYKSLSGHSIYPSKMVSIIKVGEEVNQLELFFERLSVQYSGEVEYQTGMLSKFLEPVIIIVLGLVVGIILIAMYLPLFKLGETF